MLDAGVKEIVVECPQSEIPHVVQKTLAAIADYGTTVTYTVEYDEAHGLDAAKIKVIVPNVSPVAAPQRINSSS